MTFAGVAKGPARLGPRFRGCRLRGGDRGGALPLRRGARRSRAERSDAMPVGGGRDR